MYLDLNAVHPSSAATVDHGAAKRWTVLVPFFNEQDYLAATIRSLSAQTVAMKLILIDNGSTDGGAALAASLCDTLDLQYQLIKEPLPGKVEALRNGLGWVRSRYVATCDADTTYPPHYLAAAERILDQPGCIAAGAFFVAPDATADDVSAEAHRFNSVAKLLPRQCHTGGAGQAFNTSTLRKVGGFNSARWGYVLEDHEIIHRMMQRGSMRYSTELWCMPANRERNRDSIRWTLLERLLYSVAAPLAGDWFFYRFLAPRLRERRLLSDRIRERPFQTLEGASFAIDTVF